MEISEIKSEAETEEHWRESSALTGVGSPEMETRRLEGKWENEEPDTEDPLDTIKREMDSDPLEGSPEMETRRLEGKWENEEPDTEDPLDT
ncbi:gastrula zinc finger protein 5-1-like isoform X2 [Xenopus laevis]|nr:gastrula zinc finger protein 5-1-like isoform X2 [Xenopus laevis]